MKNTKKWILICVFAVWLAVFMFYIGVCFLEILILKWKF